MKQSGSRRSVRVADEIMREVATLLVEEVQDPRINTVTVSGVRMNADLRIAEVLYSVPADASREDAAKALGKASGFLRAKLGRKLKLKFMPELRFVHDDFLEDMVYGQPSGGDR